MSQHERFQPRPVKRLFETAAAPAEAHTHDLFHVLLPRDDADRLRALADDQLTIAVDLIQRWVRERLDEHPPPTSLDWQSYPSNVVRLPSWR